MSDEKTVTKKKNTRSSKRPRKVRARAAKIAAEVYVDGVSGVAKLDRKNKFTKITADQKEVILAVYCYTENMAETARRLGIDKDTVAKVRNDAMDTGQLQEMRKVAREDFVGKAWDIIGLAMQTTADGLKNGYVKDIKDENGNLVESVSRVSPMESTRVIRDLHHTTRLEEEKPTSIVEQIASEFETDEDIIAEIERLNDEIVNNNGVMH